MGFNSFFEFDRDRKKLGKVQQVMKQG